MISFWLLLKKILWKVQDNLFLKHIVEFIKRLISSKHSNNNKNKKRKSYCFIREMSQRLNLSEEEGEKWIVNLIRDTRVDAKIDFEEVKQY